MIYMRWRCSVGILRGSSASALLWPEGNGAAANHALKCSTYHKRQRVHRVSANPCSHSHTVHTCRPPVHAGACMAQHCSSWVHCVCGVCGGGWLGEKWHDQGGGRVCASQPAAT